VRILLRTIQIQELDKKPTENILVWDVVGIGERREEYFRSRKGAYYSMANNIQYNEGKKYYPQISRTCCVHNKALQT